MTQGEAARTRSFSARWSAELLERLRSRSEIVGTSKSSLAQRYVDEGLRMEAHPGIVFRDGPSGRRAGLAHGPDVWELIDYLRQTGLGGDAAVQRVAGDLDLTIAQVRTATGYYAEFQEEIDQRITMNRELARAAEAAWRREQAALG